MAEFCASIEFEEVEYRNVHSLGAGFDFFHTDDWCVERGLWHSVYCTVGFSEYAIQNISNLAYRK